MTCKNCGAELQAADTFCGECGVKIESQEKEAVKCGECGKFFNKEFGMCPFCGTEININNIGLDDSQEAPTAIDNNDMIAKDIKTKFVSCPICNKPFDENVGICPFCGSIAATNLPTTDLSGVANDEDYQAYSKKRRKKALILVTTIILPIVCCLSIITIQLISLIFESNGRKYSDSEINEICDVLDYSALASTVEYYSDNITETYLHDADNDGRKELFMTSYNEIYEGKPVIFAFDTADVGTMASATHFGAAGNACITSASNGQLCLKWGYYSTGITNVNYEVWTNRGWYLTDTSSNASDLPNVLNTISHHTLLSRYYNAKNYEDIINAYNKHLDDYFGIRHKYIKEDVDGDGEDEYLFIMSDFGELWAQNLTTSGTDPHLMEGYINGLETIGTTVIYADADKDGIVFHTFFTDATVYVYTQESGYESDKVTVSWENSELLIKFYNEFQQTILSYFCSQVNVSKANIKNEEQAFDTVSELYIKYLKNRVYYEVLVKYADVCDAPGNELVCICTEDGISQVDVYAIYCGRIIKLYQQDLNQIGAVYLVESDGNQLLLNYTQKVRTNIFFGSETYYKYWLTNFDENYFVCDKDMNTLSIADSETPVGDDYLFFEKLNEYLDGGFVCVDEYELTGYSVMPNIQTDYSETETGKYLSISNCNLNKKGKVRVNEDSWLNFREGPAITYNKILTNSANPESFVRQMNGSSVTIIDTSNTGDAENPIWVKIQIKYSDKTLIGYSSQRYIEIADIKHIAVGETFTIEASTNDDGLHWSSNDDNILTIDSSTGKATGKNKGLVLVSVESESGLNDSCLIMVD